MRLGPEDPAKFPLLQNKLAEDVKPFRCLQRRYSQNERGLINDKIKQVEQLWAVYCNESAKWASPELAVPKHGSDDLRCTVDLRGPNLMDVSTQ